MIIKSDENHLSQINFDGDKFKIDHVERMPTGLLESNREARKDKKTVKSADGELWLVARIPQLTYMKWYREYPELRGDPDTSWKFLKKLLQKPENEVFRTYAGNL
jgi:hypothetical protein